MGGRTSLSLLLTFALLLLLLPAPSLARPDNPAPTRQSRLAAPPQQAPVHPAVWEALAAGGEADILVLLRQQADLRAANALSGKQARGRYVYDTLWTTAQRTQRGLRAMLDARGADYRPFYIVNALWVRAGSTLVQALAVRPEVDRILPNPSVKGIPDLPLEPSGLSAAQGIQANLLRVGADDVWALGHTGQGIVVAGQDTGYDWTHPALRDQYRGWTDGGAYHHYNWHDAIHHDDPHTLPGNDCGFDSPVPCDDYYSSHGTHTMGIIVGDDGQGHRIGMAPGARWIGCRNMEEGWGTPASYIECFEFFLAPYPVGGTPAQGIPSLAPHVVNNSWACPPSEGCDAAALTLMEAAVQALRQAGIVVVASAGNYGPGCGSVQYPPAIYPQTFAVGNFDHRTGRIQASSSRGPVTYNGTTYTKPDLAAPGTGIYSSLSGGAYGSLTGTSMAGPHVAGAVALLLSAAPGFRGRPAAIESLLTTTAEPRTTAQGCGGDSATAVPNNTWGWGILDAFAAVRTATAGTLHGTVADARTGHPIGGATVTAALPSGPAALPALTAPTGHYTLTLAAGTYTLTAGAPAYAPYTLAPVVILSGTLTTRHLTLSPLLRFYLPLVARDS